MRNIIQFSIQKGLDGFYIASARDFAIFTQGKTLEDLIKNIMEATQLHFEDADQLEDKISPTPSIYINYELPFSLHA